MRAISRMLDKDEEKKLINSKENLYEVLYGLIKKYKFRYEERCQI
jgi:hypothetical protein